ncbi:protein lin-9 homolog isoform X2 [Ptychodera flava]|uniref:protein lin-9 homolog isoform X2 n=1 Tax=Ptychodera flava TaxID=63121 RepID=UPI00396A5DE6
MADSALESSSAEALISLKTAGKNSPSAHYRRTGRDRKRNRRLDDYADVTSVSIKSPRKASKMSPNSHPRLTPGLMSTPDKRAAQKIGARLKNLLKLPKAYKWCIYEWFYSNVDRPLFEGENDFCVCLRENFPQLKTRKMSRTEWSTIRRLMGKPRRCSPAFFAEERSALAAKRKNVRLLQQRKARELSDFKDLPDEIPLPLVIGTKVTARLRVPQDGLFTGQIDAVDTQNATYRVTFDRPGLGTHTIPDVEVLSNELQETMPLAAFIQKQRPRSTYLTPPRLTMGTLQSPQLEHDPVLGTSPLRSRLQGLDGDTLGGFPVKFLVLVTRLSKILMIKKDQLKKLKELNTEAERLKSYQSPITSEFQRKYAGVVLELETLNKDLNTYLLGVQQYCQEIAPEQGLQPMDQPTEMKRKCEEEAKEIVRKTNLSLGPKTVKNESLTELIAMLTSLMLQIKNLAESDLNSFELKTLTESLDEIKKKIDLRNHSCFQDSVEIHVAHIQSGMSQMGNLHAFAAEQPLFL